MGNGKRTLGVTSVRPTAVGKLCVGLRGTTQLIATGLGHWRRSCERRTFAITGTQPLPLFLAKALFGSGTAVRLCVGKSDLPLSVEGRLGLIEPRLCKALRHLLVSEEEVALTVPNALGEAGFNVIRREQPPSD